MISRDLSCSVELDGKSLQVEVQLRQSDDCSVSASMLIEDDSMDEADEQIYIESVQATDSLMLNTGV